MLRQQSSSSLRLPAEMLKLTDIFATSVPVEKSDIFQLKYSKAMKQNVQSL